MLVLLFRSLRPHQWVPKNLSVVLGSSGLLWAALCVALLVACSDSSPSSTTDGDAGEADGTADIQMPDGSPVPPAIAIDGRFEDWDAVSTVVNDPAGDAEGGLDLKVVKAASRGTAVFIYLEIAETLNAHNGPPAEGTLLLELATAGGRRLTIDLRGRVAYDGGDPANNLGWSEIGYRFAPTYASDRFELRADLAAIEARLGDTITVTLSGSDALDAALPLTLTHPAPDHALRTTARDDKSQLRVASLNTWLDGITDPTRSAAARRLVRAVAADIYCFQEVFNAAPSAVAAALEAADPHDDGATWNVYPHGDVIIASRDTLVPVPPSSPLQPFAGAGVERGGARTVIFTLRPVCCGYIGDPSDQQRIVEIQALASTIDKLRQGQLGPELVPWQDAPVVVIGDWNLVGSRTPLDLLTTDPAGPGLSHWQLRHLPGDDVFTWRSFKDKDFPPGMLDLIVHSPEVKRGNGFVLDTAELDTNTLGQLGLQVTDSQVSDHLLLVADFSVK